VRNLRFSVDQAYVSSDYSGEHLRYYGDRATTSTKEAKAMSSVTTIWRERRQMARTRRALDKALMRTSSPAMRDELLTMANSGFLGR
jgi:hypothetical protein